MIGPFRGRSSWPSSIATGLIGWVGFAIIVPLALGHAEPLRELFLMAVLAAVALVVVLRLAFTALSNARRHPRRCFPSHPQASPCISRLNSWGVS